MFPNVGAVLLGACVPLSCAVFPNVSRRNCAQCTLVFQNISTCKTGNTKQIQPPQAKSLFPGPMTNGAPTGISAGNTVSARPDPPRHGVPKTHPRHWCIPDQATSARQAQQPAECKYECVAMGVPQGGSDNTVTDNAKQLGMSPKMLRKNDHEHAQPPFSV